MTTARTAGRLQQLRSVDSVFVFELAVTFGPERTVGIRDVQLHPKYDFDNPGALNSLLHDAAILTLETRVTDLPVCRLADIQEISEFTPETELRLVGHENRTEPNALFDVIHMQRRQLVVPVTGSEIHTGHSTPVLKTGVEMTRAWQARRSSILRDLLWVC